jgi:hypothetical protein
VSWASYRRIMIAARQVDGRREVHQPIIFFMLLLFAYLLYACMCVSPVILLACLLHDEGL